jgi:3-oxoacyl-[acyl-carrier protein] reductase
MNFEVENRFFIVGGAGSGFGRAISHLLAKEGAYVLAVSRTEGKLKSLVNSFPDNIEYLCGDIMSSAIQNMIVNWANKKQLSGIVFNAGGPPAGGITDMNMQMWDEAWETVVRWKIALTDLLLPIFKKQNYGRMLFIESVSVKQPVKNLVLSNALRPAIIGFAKTLSQEVAANGITVNVLAPGYHSTAAMERLFTKKAEVEGISKKEAQLTFENEIPVGEMGKPEEMASLALWLLSPLSRYVTGQTITHDGGLVSSLFG